MDVVIWGSDLLYDCDLEDRIAGAVSALLQSGQPLRIYFPDMRGFSVLVTRALRNIAPYVNGSISTIKLEPVPDFAPCPYTQETYCPFPLGPQRSSAATMRQRMLRWALENADAILRYYYFPLDFRNYYRGLRSERCGARVFDLTAPETQARLDYLISRLPRREAEILRAVSDGQTYAMVGQSRGISKEETRKIHTATIKYLRTALMPYFPKARYPHEPDARPP